MPTTKEDAQSAYYVYFFEDVEEDPTHVLNIVAVYASISLAQQAYLDEKPKNVSLVDPEIGDESFLDISIPVVKRIVFRKANVVVWLWVFQDPSGDYEPYARKIERKM